MLFFFCLASGTSFNLYYFSGSLWPMCEHTLCWPVVYWIIYVVLHFIGPKISFHNFFIPRQTKDQIMSYVTLLENHAFSFSFFWQNDLSKKYLLYLNAGSQWLHCEMKEWWWKETALHQSLAAGNDHKQKWM